MGALLTGDDQSSDAGHRIRFSLMNPNRATLAFVLKYITSADRRPLYAICAAVCLLSLVGSLAPFALAKLVAVAGQVDRELRWAALYSVAIIAPTAFGFACQKQLLRTLSRLTELIRIACISIAIRGRAARVTEASSGQLFSIIETDVDRFEDVISALVAQVPQHIVVIGSILLTVWINQPTFGPWIAVFAIALLVYALVPKSRSIALTAKARAARELCNSQLDLFLSHARLLMTGGGEKRGVRVVLQSIDSARRITFSANILSQLVASTPQIALALATVCYLAVVSSLQNTQNAVALPFVLAVTIYLEQVLSPVANLASTSARLHACLPSLHRVTDCFVDASDNAPPAECRADDGIVRLQLGLLSGQACETTLTSHKVWMAPNGAGKTTALMSVAGLRESQNNKVFIGDRLLSSGELELKTLYFDSQALGIWRLLVPGSTNIEYIINAVRQSIKNGNTPIFACFDETLDRVAKDLEEINQFIQGLNDLGVISIIVTHKESFRDRLISLGCEEIICEY